MGGRRQRPEVMDALLRWRLKATVVLLLLALVSSGIWAEEIPRVLTVQEAMRLAIERNPSVAAARSGLDASEAALEAQRARRLPTMTAGVSGRMQQALGRPVTVNGETITTGRGVTETSDMSVNLRHTFLESGRTEAIAAADARLDVTEASFADVQRALARNVAAAYYSVLADQEFAEVAQEAVRSAELTLELVEARIEAGTAAEAERLPAEADLARARFDALSAENRIWESLAEFRALLALPPDEQPLLRGELDEVEPVDQLQQWVDRGLERRPDIEAQRHRIRVAELGLQQQRIQDGLTFSVQGQADYGRWTGVTGDTWMIAAGVSYPLFDRGSSARVAEAEASLETSRQNLAELEHSVTREITQAWYGLRDGGERVASAEAALRAAETSLDAVRARYAEGVATIIEVTDAELVWRQASASLVQARYDRVVAFYRLLAAGGEELVEREIAETFEANEQ